jgi:hypothetical protein
MVRRLCQHDFERWSYSSLDEMPAASAAILLTQHNVHMNIWLSLVQGNVTDQGEDLNLLMNRNVCIILLLSVKVAEYDIFEGADGGKVACR